MSSEQESQWREEFESTISDLPLSPREERLRRSPHQSSEYFWNSVQSQWEGYLSARKKAQKEIDGLNEKLALIKEIKQYPTALTYISELKEELKRERLFSSKFEIQSTKGYPTPKEWSDLTSENMKTQQRRKVEI